MLNTTQIVKIVKTDDYSDINKKPIMIFSCSTSIISNSGCMRSLHHVVTSMKKSHKATIIIIIVEGD